MHWYHRYRISNALDGGTLAAMLAGGHVARCTRCQAYARDLQALHARLALGAPSAPAPTRPAPRRQRWPLLVAAPLALAAAALAVSLASSGPGEPGGPAEPISVAPPTPAAYGARVRDVADRVTAVLASGESPLDSELHNLIHDGRRGFAAVLATGGLHASTAE